MSEAAELGAWLRRKTAEAVGRLLQEEATGRSEGAAIVPLRRPDGRFPKGVSGNPAGRPKGLRDRLAGDLLSALAESFAEHGADAIRRLRERDPGGYLMLIFRVVAPALREMHAEPEPSILDRFDVAELAELRKQLEEAVALARAGHPLILPPILAAAGEDQDAGDDG